MALFIETRASEYTQAFTNQTSVTVTHNLGYKPGVRIEDGSGNIIDNGDINHASVNAFTITFQDAQSGTIHYK